MSDYERLEMARELASVLRAEGFERTVDEILERAEYMAGLLNTGTTMPDECEEWTIERMIYDATVELNCRRGFLGIATD